MILLLAYSSHAVDLAYSGICSYAGQQVACSAAQWTFGGAPEHLHVAGSIVRLNLSESCTNEGPANRVASPPQQGVIAVVPRGRCSFVAKALVAQSLGFAGLVILDPTATNESTIQPPGLGDASHQIKILVVMVAESSWPSKSETSQMAATIDFAEPNEAGLWLSSPWYLQGDSTSRGSPTSLSAVSWHNDPLEKETKRDAPWRFAPLCDRARLGEISDDTWLYRQWLDELDSEVAGTYQSNRKSCQELRNMIPQIILSRPKTSLSSYISIHSLDHTTLEKILALMHAGNGTEFPSSSIPSSDSHGFVHLPYYDASSEVMADLELLLPIASASSTGDRKRSFSSSSSSSSTKVELLRGLNSNSHQFPWDGRNTYPRYFRGGVLVVKRGCIHKDGIVVAYSSGHEQNNGGDQESESKGRVKRQGVETGDRGKDTMGEERPPPPWLRSGSPRGEYHSGGCGCCPLGHGELGFPFADQDAAGAWIAPPLTYPGQPGKMPIPKHRRKLVSLVQRFHHVYYHHVFEVLPRLLQVLDLLTTSIDPVTGRRDWQVLVDTSGGSFVEQYLIDVFGLEQYQIVPFSKNNAYCADLLLVPAPVPCGNVPRSITIALREAFQPWMHEIVDKLSWSELINSLSSATKSAFSSDTTAQINVDEFSFPSRFHLDSSRATTALVLVLKRLGTRSVANHDEMVKVLRSVLGKDGKPGSEKLSYTVLDIETSTMAVSTQAAWFRRASVVIGPHGSGLSNALFMRKGSILFELLPWEYPNLTFYVALSWLPVRHIAYLVDGANAYRPMNINCSEFARLVAHVLNQAK